MEQAHGGSGEIPGKAGSGGLLPAAWMPKIPPQFIHAGGLGVPPGHRTGTQGEPQTVRGQPSGRVLTRLLLENPAAYPAAGQTHLVINALDAEHIQWHPVPRECSLHLIFLPQFVPFLQSHHDNIHQHGQPPVCWTRLTGIPELREVRGRWQPGQRQEEVVYERQQAEIGAVKRTGLHLLGIGHLGGHRGMANSL